LSSHASTSAILPISMALNGACPFSMATAFTALDESGAHRCGRANVTNLVVGLQRSFDSARAQGAARGGF
jgi:hypothetical protein